MSDWLLQKLCPTPAPHETYFQKGTFAMVQIEPTVQKEIEKGGAVSVLLWWLDLQTKEKQMQAMQLPQIKPTAAPW